MDSRNSQQTTDLKKGFIAGSGAIPTFGVMFFGFGLAATIAGIAEWQVLLITFLVFAAPAQFAMVDVATQGGGVLQVIFIAVLVNLRFFPMSLTLAGITGPDNNWKHVICSQFVSATTYLTTFFGWRRGGVEDPFRYYQGVVLATVPIALFGTAVGIWLGAGLPQMFAFVASLFLPIYFTLLLKSEDKTQKENLAIVSGLVLTPAAELLLPGLGLFLVALFTGLVLEWSHRYDK